LDATFFVDFYKLKVKKTGGTADTSWPWKWSTGRKWYVATLRL